MHLVSTWISLTHVTGLVVLDRSALDGSDQHNTSHHQRRQKGQHLRLKAHHCLRWFNNVHLHFPYSTIVLGTQDVKSTETLCDVQSMVKMFSLTLYEWMRIVYSNKLSSETGVGHNLRGNPTEKTFEWLSNSQLTEYLTGVVNGFYNIQRMRAELDDTPPHICVFYISKPIEWE